MAQGVMGITFKVTRALQAACMVAIIGMTSNFVSQIIAANASPPSVLIGTLSVVCIAVLYCVITFLLYLDNLLPFLIATVVDGAFLIALIIVSVVVGKPLSYVNCEVVGKATRYTSEVPSLTSALMSIVGDGGNINYGIWVGINKSTCLEMKSIWGLTIALCILFTLSATTTICLWKTKRSTTKLAKGEA